jgi:hypothetical protein
MLDQPNCSKRRCVHFIGPVAFGEEEVEDEFTRMVCEAFPEGIPDDIAYGKNKHIKSYKGDNGIRYERDNEE